MTKRMLIDATHAEETRVVVLDGSRLEDFDVETAGKRQLKGNIYLAKVVRVEPSLQAAFVEYGGNRHGFLAFAEIHPDYYQIPVADRQRLIAMELEQARLEEEQADLELALESGTTDADEQPALPIEAEAHPEEDHEAAIAAELTPVVAAPEPEAIVEEAAPSASIEPAQPLAIVTEVLVAPVAPEPEPEPVALAEVPAEAPVEEPPAAEPATIDVAATEVPVADTPAEEPAHEPEPVAAAEPEATPAAEFNDDAPSVEVVATEADPFDPPEPFVDSVEEPFQSDGVTDDDSEDTDEIEHDEPPPETIGGGDTDTGEERPERRAQTRFMRHYKIQEVIHRRQILLVQVVKEERGTKGAALTTYLSLAGRFSVLMPNSPRGGGISRKITSAADRRRLKEVMTELDIPRGMGMIVRTAGAQRPKPEIKRDCEYLLRLWDDIRELTMKSMAPALIYEEASLIKRAIRDVYSRDIDEILVDGEDGWRAAHDFMRMLMPTHAKKVQLWRDPQPLFARGQVEAQLDAMLQPIVQLRSGGYLVINQTEALVAIDVNSGRATRERNIEETALRTNLEAADEAARQLRLRDLAGLIVIDFIDMESKRHNAMVERRIKEALKNDRARIQVGHISHFGLLEMSRQRLRPSLAEASFIACPHCGGTGHVRSTENAAIHVLRGIEEEGGKRRASEIVVHVGTPIALYLLNHKRERIQEIEARYGMRVIIAADDSQSGTGFRIERTRARAEGEFVPAAAPAGLPPLSASAHLEADDEALPSDEDEAGEAAPKARGESGEDSADQGKRRRRRRRRGRREDGASPQAAEAEAGEDADGEGESDADEAPSDESAEAPAPSDEPQGDEAPAEETAADSEDDGKSRRRGRRGGRRKRRDGGEPELTAVAEPDAEQPPVPPLPAYAGPTPANPFGGDAFDIFDVLEQAEQRAAAQVHTAEPTPEPQPEPEPVAVVEPAQEPAPVPAVEAVSEPAPVPAPEPEPIAVIPEPEPEPEPQPEPALALVAEAPPEPERPLEPVVGPAIQPVVIGEAPPAEKKRGWWRR